MTSNKRRGGDFERWVCKQLNYYRPFFKRNWAGDDLQGTQASGDIICPPWFPWQYIECRKRKGISLEATLNGEGVVWDWFDNEHPDLLIWRTPNSKYVWCLSEHHRAFSLSSCCPMMLWSGWQRRGVIFPFSIIPHYIPRWQKIEQPYPLQSLPPLDELLQVMKDRDVVYTGQLTDVQLLDAGYPLLGRR